MQQCLFLTEIHIFLFFYFSFASTSIVFFPFVKWNNVESNNTRFIIIGKQLENRNNSDRVSIVFTLQHKVGTLSLILKVIKDHQINLSRIESRPIKDKPWQYYFYIDFEGSLNDNNVKIALEQLKTNCLTLRVLGNYCHA